ncbi:MAG TPA: hypothetical protein PK694_06230 [Rhodospirillales bacterium]|nr:hypothetical protein [Rhodospirillales bacterium]
MADAEAKRGGHQSVDGGEGVRGAGLARGGANQMARLDRERGLEAGAKGLLLAGEEEVARGKPGGQIFLKLILQMNFS